jgi:crotonobetaine/carnitine-CoA ligase
MSIDTREWEEPAPVDQRNLPAMLERGARLYGSKLFLRVGDVARSFTEMRDSVARWASALKAAGIRPGDRVATLCGNRMEQFDAIFGCLWFGAIAVPLNTGARGRQLQQMFDNSRPRLLMLDPQHASALASVSGLEYVDLIWCLDEESPALDAFPHVERRVVSGFDALECMPIRQVDPGEPCAILYTSGTTGASKGVTWPAGVLYWWGRIVADVIGITENDVLYNCLPAFHANALLAPVEGIVKGASTVIGKKFSASRFWDDCIEATATITYLLGGMTGILCEKPPHPSDRAHRIRRVFAPDTPASAIGPFIARFGINDVQLGYGSTETSHCIGRAPGHDYSNPGEMGRVLDRYFEARVVNARDEDMPDGVPGQLILRNKYPYSFALGYWGMPEKTVEAFRNLWFHTGDNVARNADGVWRWVDRAKDSIRRFGENISTFEVEDAILQCVDVAEAAVFGVPSELDDEEVMAVVVFKPGTTADVQALARQLQGALAANAIPRYFRILSELPYTETGKVAKPQLRAHGVDASTWDRRKAAS